MKRLRDLLHLVLCCALSFAAGAPVHATIPRTPPMTMAAPVDAAPCHDAMPAGPSHQAHAPAEFPHGHGHGCCAPDACHCAATAGLACRSIAAILVGLPAGHAAWTAASPSGYVSPSIDTSLRPPIA